MSLNNISDSELLQAIALYYDGEHAPSISAKGEGSVAEEIVQIAQECGVPLCDNSELVTLLMALELGDTIPEALYLSVAYIIAFAYDLTGKTPDNFSPE